MLSKYGNCTCLLKIKNNAENWSFLQIKSGRILNNYFVGVSNKTIIPLALVGYETITADCVCNFYLFVSKTVIDVPFSKAFFILS